LINIRFQPAGGARAGAIRGGGGGFTDINQETLKGIRLSEERDDL
jgi:hypothetical protein